MKKSCFLVAAVAAALSFTGCRTYIPPGAKADLQHLAPPSIQAGFDLKPTNPFPAGIALVRIQSPGYTNYNLRRSGGSYGSGNYTVIMTHEVEDQSHLDRISRLPQVAGIVSLNRMLIPEHLESDRQIREAASRVQADLVFLYTFETAFYDHNASTPLTVITLGLSPTRKITASTTVSALLIDTRTGYIYSAYESTERAEMLSTSWGSGETADEARRQTEKKAFDKLVDDVATSWPRLLRRYEKNSAHLSLAP